MVVMTKAPKRRSHRWLSRSAYTSNRRGMSSPAAGMPPANSATRASHDLERSTTNGPSADSRGQAS
jgi:hypothetical protein